MWLEKHHDDSGGIRIRFLKKHVKKPCVAHSDAIDLALCFGWIDSQVQKGDSDSWLHRFTPRGAKSIWSKRNIEHIARLTKEKRMRPAGLEEVKKAKKDGRWKQAYDPPSTMKIPEDFLKALSTNKKSAAFFATLNRVNLYAIAWRLQTAKKPETRAKRMNAILEMLKNNKTFH